MNNWAELKYIREMKYLTNISTFELELFHLFKKKKEKEKSCYSSDDSVVSKFNFRVDIREKYSVYKKGDLAILSSFTFDTYCQFL